jgi:glycosyltransferase involved in cell wall biosynthesis
MQVLQVSAMYYPELQFGGPPHKIHALSRGLVERGHQVRVITIHSTRPLAHHSQIIDGVEIQYVPWVGRGWWCVPFSFDSLVKAVQQATLVHCYGLYNLLCPGAALWACRMSRPYLLEPLGMYPARGRNRSIKAIYHRLFTAPMARGAARVIATSPGEMKHLASLVDSKQLVLRRNGIDVALFQNLPLENGFRARYNVGDQERLVLFIGRISPVKNLEGLVQAFGQAALEGARLILAGPMLEPGYADRLQRLIADLSLGERVSLVGPLYGQDKLSALAAADLFVLPSISESFGNAAAEAAAAGVPVLLTQGCGIAPLIHGQAGLAVEHNPAALAQGLRLMLNDAGERARLTARRADVVAELSWAEPLNQTEQLYTQITHSCSSCEPETLK